MKSILNHASDIWIFPNIRSGNEFIILRYHRNFTQYYKRKISIYPFLSFLLQITDHKVGDVSKLKIWTFIKKVVSFTYDFENLLNIHEDSVDFFMSGPFWHHLPRYVKRY